MGRNVSNANRQVPVQSQDGQQTLALKTLVKSPNEVQAEDGTWILPLVSEAINIGYPGQRTGAAYTMNLDPSHMNRLLEGDGHLSVRKLGLLNGSFWRALNQLVDKKHGFEDDEAQLERAIEALQASITVIARIARRGVR